MYCGNCGNRLPDGTKFCNKCGNRLGIANENRTVKNEYKYNDPEETRLLVQDDEEKTVIMPQESMNNPYVRYGTNGNGRTGPQQVKRENNIPHNIPPAQNLQYRNPQMQQQHTNRNGPEKPKQYDPKVKSKKKKSILLPVIIIIAVLLLIAAVLAVMFWDDLFGNEKTDVSSIESSAEISNNISEEVSEESKEAVKYYGESGILLGMWSLETENCSYKLDLKEDGSADILITRSSGSTTTLNSEFEFVDSLSAIKDINELEYGEKLGIVADARKDRLVIKLNDNFVVLMHKEGVLHSINDDLSGYWRKGTFTITFGDETIKYGGISKKYIALNEKEYYIYDASGESEYIFDGGIGISGAYVSVYFTEDGDLTVNIAGKEYSSMKHVE